MSRWRKKPVEVDAFQWTGDVDQKEDPEWIVEAIRSGKARIYSGGGGIGGGPVGSLLMLIETKEGTMRAHPGDFIIRGVAGELYPCQPDIFAATYEKVSD